MKFTSIPEVSVEMIDWLRVTMAKFAINQKDLANKSGLNQSWLSQLLSRRRRLADPILMEKLCSGLMKQCEVYLGDDKNEVISQMQEWFAPYKKFGTINYEAADPMHIAADLFAILAEWCKQSNLRELVIEHLRSANEISKKY